MILFLMVYVAMAISAVPLASLLLQAWFLKADWRKFNLPVYLGAWALVALIEIFGLVALTGESLPILVVGFWSTIGAVIIGGVWWMASPEEGGERRNG